MPVHGVSAALVEGLGCAPLAGPAVGVAWVPVPFREESRRTSTIAAITRTTRAAETVIVVFLVNFTGLTLLELVTPGCYP